MKNIKNRQGHITIWKTMGYFLSAFVLLFSACGKNNTTKLVSMYDLRVAMEAADDSLPEMTNINSSEDGAKDQFAKYVCEVDYDKVAGFFVSYAVEGGLADEIVVVAVKDASDVKEVKELLEKHKQDRYHLLEQYEPKEVKRVSDGLVFTDGNYAVLIICDRADAVKKAFSDVVHKE